ncbi:MAG: hypothetical protein HY362_04265 [Candidatus Aenigmarchaeota archaeon]|nr:hypothetical protein [Candidatus Aenigmarchaeota archaeon]
MVNGILREGIKPLAIAGWMNVGVREVDRRVGVGVYERVELEHGPPAVPTARCSVSPAPLTSLGSMSPYLVFLAEHHARDSELRIGLYVPPAKYTSLAGFTVDTPLQILFDGNRLRVEHSERGFEHVGEGVIKRSCIPESIIGVETEAAEPVAGA